MTYLQQVAKNNPGESALNIKIDRNLGYPFKLQIINMHGTIVYSQSNIDMKNIQIDIGNFSKGIYFVKINTNEIYYIRKFIKN